MRQTKLPGNSLNLYDGYMRVTVCCKKIVSLTEAKVKNFFLVWKKKPNRIRKYFSVLEKRTKPKKEKINKTEMAESVINPN